MAGVSGGGNIGWLAQPEIRANNNRIASRFIQSGQSEIKTYFFFALISHSFWILVAGQPINFDKFIN